MQINGDRILSIMRRMDFESHTSYCMLRVKVLAC